MEYFPKRGDIYLVDLSGAVGSEQAGIRPCIIVSNDIGNRYSPLVHTVPITSKVKKEMPFHVKINNLREPSIALCEQVGRIDKMRLIEYIGTVGEREMQKIDRALMVIYGLFNYIPSGEGKRETIFC
jgi:mRNA interferase MazF